MADFSEISWSLPVRRTKKSVRMLLEHATACARDFDGNFEMDSEEKDTAVPQFHPDEVVLDETSMKLSGFFTEYELAEISMEEHGTETKHQFASHSNSGFYSVKFLADFIVDSDHATNAITEMILETKILMSIAPHPNLCRIYGVTDQGMESFLHAGLSRYFFITDLVSETFEERMDYWREQIRCKGKDSALTQRLGVALEVASALVYLHDRKLVFYIRPDKVGFDKQYGRVKLFNFGESRQHGMRSHPRTVTQSDDIRKLAFTAPEVICKAPAFLGSDVYGFGIMLWEMMSLERAFEGLDRAMHFEEVVKSNQRSLDLDEIWGEGICQLLQNSLHPHKRPTMQKVHSVLETEIRYQQSENGVCNGHEENELVDATISQSGGSKENEESHSLSSMMPKDYQVAKRPSLRCSKSEILSREQQLQGRSEERACIPAINAEEMNESQDSSETMSDESPVLSIENKDEDPLTMLRRAVSSSHHASTSRLYNSTRRIAPRTRRGVKKTLSADRLDEFVSEDALLYSKTKGAVARVVRQRSAQLKEHSSSNNLEVEDTQTPSRGLSRTTSDAAAGAKMSPRRAVSDDAIIQMRGCLEEVMPISPKTPAAAVPIKTGKKRFAGLQRLASVRGLRSFSSMEDDELPHDNKREEASARSTRRLSLVTGIGEKLGPTHGPRSFSSIEDNDLPSDDRLERATSGQSKRKMSMGSSTRAELGREQGHQSVSSMNDGNSPNGNKCEQSSVRSRRSSMGTSTVGEQGDEERHRSISSIKDDASLNGNMRKESSVRSRRKMSMQRSSSFGADDDAPNNTKKRKQTPVRSRRRMSMQQSSSSFADSDSPNNDKKRDQTPVRSRRRMSMQQSSSFIADDDLSKDKREPTPVRSRRRMSMQQSNSFGEGDMPNNDKNKRKQTPLRSRRRMSMKSSLSADDGGDLPTPGQKRERGTVRTRKKMSMPQACSSTEADTSNDDDDPKQPPVWVRRRMSMQQSSSSIEEDDLPKPGTRRKQAPLRSRRRMSMMTGSADGQGRDEGYKTSTVGRKERRVSC